MTITDPFWIHYWSIYQLKSTKDIWRWWKFSRINNPYVTGTLNALLNYGYEIVTLRSGSRCYIREYYNLQLLFQHSNKQQTTTFHRFPPSNKQLSTLSTKLQTTSHRFPPNNEQASTQQHPCHSQKNYWRIIGSKYNWKKGNSGGHVPAPTNVGQVDGHSFQEPPEDPIFRGWAKCPLADHI